MCVCFKSFENNEEWEEEDELQEGNNTYLNQIKQQQSQIPASNKKIFSLNSERPQQPKSTRNHFSIQRSNSGKTAPPGASSIYTSSSASSSSSTIKSLGPAQQQSKNKLNSSSNTATTTTTAKPTNSKQSENGKQLTNCLNEKRFIH